jgi:hypothetical protein
MTGATVLMLGPIDERLPPSGQTITLIHGLHPVPGRLHRVVQYQETQVIFTFRPRSHPNEFWVAVPYVLVTLTFFQRLRYTFQNLVGRRHPDSLNIPFTTPTLFPEAFLVFSTPQALIEPQLPTPAYLSDPHRDFMSNSGNSSDGSLDSISRRRIDKAVENAMVRLEKQRQR